jgi:hypothetical protein
MMASEFDADIAGEIVALMQKSAARMSAMIDNVLDFARGRLGSGIALNRRRSRCSRCRNRSSRNCAPVTLIEKSIPHPAERSSRFGCRSIDVGNRLRLNDRLDSSGTKREHHSLSPKMSGTSREGFRHG